MTDDLTHAREFRANRDVLATVDCPVVIGGPFPPAPTVRFCDLGGERLPSDAHWWLVQAPDRSWEADRGASCAAHCGEAPVPAPLRRPRDGYSQAVEWIEDGRPFEGTRTT